MSSIWNTIKNEKKTANATKELTDEIKSFRQKNKEFNATNESNTYCVLVFSCESDKVEFLRNLQIKNDTYFDGYKFADLLGVNPKKPSLKLPKPLNK